MNSPTGSVFITMDVSDVVKNANLLFKILDDLVEEVGEENVVQVVTVMLLTTLRRIRNKNSS